MTNRSSHSAAVLAMAVLAACASPTPQDWRQVQRERLERSHQQIPLAETLARVIAQAPRPSGQDPQPATMRLHIDQREPALPGTGPRPFRSSLQPLVVAADYGVGRVGVRVNGTRLDDREKAQFARLMVDAGTGAALHVDLIGSGDHLFAGTRLNDGVAPAWADASLSGIDAFPHYRLDTSLGAVRLGVFVDWQQLDHEPSGVVRDWLSCGPRIAWEPSLYLVGEGSHGLELFGRAAADAGATWFTEEYRNGTDHDTTWRWAGDVAAGLRAYLGSAHAELGCRWNYAAVQRVDSALLGNRGRTELGSEQLFLGFGLTY